VEEATAQNHEFDREAVLADLLNKEPPAVEDAKTGDANRADE
jgi:hypothetical protein